MSEDTDYSSEIESSKSRRLKNNAVKMSSKTVGIKLDKNNLTEQKINLHNTSTEEINSSFLNSQVIFNFDGTVNIKQEEGCSSEERLTSEESAGAKIFEQMKIAMNISLSPVKSETFSLTDTHSLDSGISPVKKNNRRKLSLTKNLQSNRDDYLKNTKLENSNKNEEKNWKKSNKLKNLQSQDLFSSSQVETEYGSVNDENETIESPDIEINCYQKPVETSVTKNQNSYNTQNTPEQTDITNIENIDEADEDLLITSYQKPKMKKKKKKSKHEKEKDISVENILNTLKQRINLSEVNDSITVSEEDVEITGFEIRKKKKKKKKTSKDETVDVRKKKKLKKKKKYLEYNDNSKGDVVVVEENNQKKKIKNKSVDIIDISNNNASEIDQKSKKKRKFLENIDLKEVVEVVDENLPKKKKKKKLVDNDVELHLNKSEKKDTMLAYDHLKKKNKADNSIQLNLNNLNEKNKLHINDSIENEGGLNEVTLKKKKKSKKEKHLENETLKEVVDITNENNGDTATDKALDKLLQNIPEVNVTIEESKDNANLIAVSKKSKKKSSKKSCDISDPDLQLKEFLPKRKDTVTDTLQTSKDQCLNKNDNSLQNYSALDKLPQNIPEVNVEIEESKDNVNPIAVSKKSKKKSSKKSCDISDPDLQLKEFLPKRKDTVTDTLQTSKDQCLNKNDNSLQNYLDEEKDADDVELSLMDLIDVTEEEKNHLRSLTILQPNIVPPLHEITLNSAKLTPEIKDQIKAFNLKVKLGPYTKTEDDQIKQNWTNFCELHGIDLNPGPFLKLKSLKFSRKQIRGFLQSLGQGLDNRPLNSIYMRFKRMFIKAVIKSGQFTKDEDNEILNHIENGTSRTPYHDLSKRLNRERLSIEKRYKYLTTHRPPKENIRVVWDSTMELALVNRMLKVIGSKDINDLRDRKLTGEEWKRVAKKLNFGSDLRLKRKWATIYTQIFMTNKVTSYSEVKKQIVHRLQKKKVADWREVKWNEIAKKFEGFTADKIYSIFKNLVYNHVPPQFQNNIEDCLNYLDDFYIKNGREFPSHSHDTSSVLDTSVGHQVFS
ncbi:uncharacterized protein MAL13P1.304 isoform X2 [Aethina tumida]|uniref:uncharacterized protein MAL13P1.304 isoform X2 n=1 Tax=Aethina tumida TaxID=116153 RepID=UPI002148BC77|nr:uncharacterized protein MAL13P1.304 isoform X2 [Aethina tumida]